MLKAASNGCKFAIDIGGIVSSKFHYIIVGKETYSTFLSNSNEILKLTRNENWIIQLYLSALIIEL